MKRLITFVMVSLLIFAVPMVAIAGEVSPYVEPKIIKTTYNTWQGLDALNLTPGEPIHLITDMNPGNAGYKMIVRHHYPNNDIIWEYINLTPWQVEEFTRNYIYGSPVDSEIISINDTPWQILTSPGVFSKSSAIFLMEEFKDLEPEDIPGFPTMADGVKFIMTNPDNPYTSTRPQLPTGDRKMVSIYDNQTIATLYTSTTAIPKHLLARPYTTQRELMIPVRGVIDYLGAEIGWDSISSSIVISYKDKDIRLKIGDKTAYVNGVAKQLSVAPTIAEGYTMVPLKSLSNELGLNVRWLNINHMDSSVLRADIYN